MRSFILSFFIFNLVWTIFLVPHTRTHPTREKKWLNLWKFHMISIVFYLVMGWIFFPIKFKWFFDYKPANVCFCVIEILFFLLFFKQKKNENFNEKKAIKNRKYQRMMMVVLEIKLNSNSFIWSLRQWGFFVHHHRRRCRVFLFFRLKIRKVIKQNDKKNKGQKECFNPRNKHKLINLF